MTESYPHTPPQVLVTPTPEMIITANHPNVDAKGVCMYLCLLTFPLSSLRTYKLQVIYHTSLLGPPRAT